MVPWLGYSVWESDHCMAFCRWHCNSKSFVMCVGQWIYEVVIDGMRLIDIKIGWRVNICLVRKRGALSACHFNRQDCTSFSHYLAHSKGFVPPQYRLAAVRPILIIAERSIIVLVGVKRISRLAKWIALYAKDGDCSSHLLHFPNFRWTDNFH